MKAMGILIKIACAALLIETINSCLCWHIIAYCSNYDCGNTFALFPWQVCGCYTCNPGFYRTSGLSCDGCQSIFTNCITCDQSTCHTCQPTYAVNTAGTCSLCSSLNAGCNSCTLNTSPQKCFACDPGFLIDTVIFRCYPCSYPIPNCMYCTNSTYCTLCKSNYQLNGLNQCQPCRNFITNCQACAVATSCLRCDIGTLLMASNTLCTRCEDLMDSCSRCSSTTVCQKCNQTTLGVNYTAIPNTCIPCNSDLDYCQECTTYTFCTACINNFYTLLYTSSLNQTCVTCQYHLLGCSTCSDNTTCLSCIANDTFLYDSTGELCYYCNHFLALCSTCAPNFMCLTCSVSTHAISPAGKCQLCGIFMQFCDICTFRWNCTRCLSGRLVPDQTGCSRIVGCSSVNPLDPISDNCLSCGTIEFHLLPVFGRCECLQGWIVGLHCTTVVGCTSVALVNNQSRCIACNQAKHFQLYGTTCICAPHYSFTGSDCIETCGDGFVINAECDDGNLIDGDGCSSSCDVEPSFQCENDNGRDPSSKCKFKAKMQLSVSNINKLAAPYTVQIIYDITPYTNRVRMSNPMDQVNLRLSGCTITTAQYTGEQLVVTFKYARTIQAQIATIQIDFDSEYILSPKAVLNFRMLESEGVPLVYQQQFEFDPQSAMVITALSIISLIVFLVGSIAFKMIGVQTLYSIQISWFLMNTSKYFKTFFINFKTLNYSYGQLLLTREGYKLMSRFGNLGFTSSINDNYLLYTILNALIIIAYIVVFIYKFILNQRVLKLQQKIMSKVKTKNKLLKVTNQQIQKINRIQKQIYNWALFPLVFGFFLHFLHTLYASEFNDNRQTPIYYALPLFLLFVATSLIFHFQLFALKSKKAPEGTLLIKSEQKIYVAYFIVHNFFVFVLLSLRMIKNNEVFCYISIALIIIHTIYLIVKSPYQSQLDNFSIIFKQFAILFTFGWILTKGTFIDTFYVSTFCVYTFISVFYLVNALGVARSIKVFKQWLAEKKVQTIEKQQQETRQVQAQQIEMVRFPKKMPSIEQAMMDAKTDINEIALQNPFLNYKGQKRINTLSVNNRLR